MPHSTTDLHSQVNAASTKTMTSTSSYANGRLNGGASTVSLDSKWRRASLPVSDIYTELRSSNDGPRGRSGSITSTASTAVIHRKSQYYDSSSHGLTREKVIKDSPMIAELRTNVIIKDEYTLVTDLSYHLATRYSKPDSAIMINIDHSSCLALAGTFDPCYILTITTIPTYQSAALNKRNASLIQSFMADILSVPPDRGIIRFVPASEDNYATNGSTVAAELERAEKYSGAENGVKRALTDGRRAGPGYKRSTVDLDARQKANPASSDERTEKEKRAERRRSTAPAQAGAEVFELAAETTDRRPSTSNTSPTAAENGLRMNTVSKEDLTRTTNGRPKSIAARSTSQESTAAEAAPAVKAKHISTVARSNEQQKAAHMPKPRSDSKGRRQSTGARSAGGQATPITLKETIVDNPKVLKAIESDSGANTSKRRSTMTATPKIPAPPPVPESKTPKVSKRKSFLAAFRL